MGGIPGQSRGCTTCRRRKVKCDEGRPTCIRCINGRFKCGGYERRRQFIHVSSDSPQERWHSSAQPGSQTSRRPPPERQLPSVEQLNLTVPQRSQFLASFIHAFLPEPDEGDDRGNIIGTLPSLLGGNPLLDNAITAVSTAFLSNTNHDHRLKQEAMRLYSTTLRGMLHEILHSRRPTDDVLHTSVILGYYELISSSVGDTYGWVSHSVGACQLLQRRGCPSTENPMAKRLYQRLELLSFYTAVGQRKSAFLSDSSWRGAQKQAGSNDYFDTLMTCLVDCTTLIEYLDRLVKYQHSPGSLAMARKLLYHCLLVEAKFLRWYEDEFQKSPEWCAPWENPHLSSPLATSTAIQNSSPWFSTHFDYSSFRVAQTHLLYWTGLVLLYPVMAQLVFIFGIENLILPNETFQQEQQSETDDRPSPRQQNEYTAAQRRKSRNANDYSLLADQQASNICRSAAYCIQPKFKAIGPQTILSPMWAAQQFYLSQPCLQDKSGWCVAAFDIVNSIGLGFASRIAKLPWSEYPKEQRISALCR